MRPNTVHSPHAHQNHKKMKQTQNFDCCTLCFASFPHPQIQNKEIKRGVKKISIILSQFQILESSWRVDNPRVPDPDAQNQKFL